MPRYMVERTFPDGLAIPVNEQGAATCLLVVDNNTQDGVTWVHSSVTEDKRKTFCIYDGRHRTPGRAAHGATAYPSTASRR